MATLTVQDIVLTGLNPSYVVSAVGGDEFANDGKTFIHVKNGHTSAWVVTVDSVAPCSQGYDHNAVVSIPASGERIIGPFDKHRFDDSAGKVQITYDGVTVLTIAAIRLP